MISPWLSLVALASFFAAIALGMTTRRKIQERYLNHDTSAVLHATVAMLVTFSAIVLGLLMDSSKEAFSRAESVTHNFASSLISLDDALHGAGSGGVPIQKALADYTATVIASTWTTQQPPPGDFYPKNFVQPAPGQVQETVLLSEMLGGIGDQIADLPATNRPERLVQTHCTLLYSRIVEQRANLITASQVSLSVPFLGVLIFWLFTAFLCLGLCAPANYLSITVTGLGAIALASALFVIIELNSLYDNGLFSVSSRPLHAALAHITHT